MGADAGVMTAAPPRGDSLTRRASLTAAASLLDYGAKMVVGLVVTPLLLRGLGSALYGVWEMLTRLINYITASDGRPTEALRLVVARNQAAAASRQRRYVGSAVVVWLLFLPLVLGVGAALTWLAPSITKAPPELRSTVRLASGLLVVSFLVASLSAIPESVLRGMNVGYRRMGLQATLNLIGGLCMAGAVAAGLGLAGLASSQIIIGAITGVCFWVLATKYVAWFGLERPERPDVKAMAAMSGWLAFGDLIAKLLLASDIIVLGALIHPVAVTTYVLTGYAARTTIGILTFVVSAAIPGFGGVIGSGDHSRAATLRREMLALTWLFVTVAGGTILLWNRSFVSLWVGSSRYAGSMADLLIVVIALQTAFIRTDAYLIDAALRPKQRVTVGAAAAALTIALEIILTRTWGIPGLCAGLILGRAVQSVAYPVLVRASLRQGSRDSSAGTWHGWPTRAAAATLGLFGLAAYVNRYLTPSHWAVWAAAVVVSIPVLGALAFQLGLPSGARTALRARGAMLRRMIGV